MNAFALDPDVFATTTAPESNRRCLQLTVGEADCYPLYYFIDTITADGRYLIHHRAENDTVGLYRLDLATGADDLLYQGDTSPSGWRPWDIEAGRGAYDHRSVLDVQGGRLIVFDGRAIRAVEVTTGAVEELFALPEGRMPIGQNCITGDGRHLVWIDADESAYRATLEGEEWTYQTYHAARGTCKGTRLMAYDFATGDQHLVVAINSPIHHVLPMGPDGLVFCHPTAENGMLVTDVQGGWCTHCRTQDDDGGCVCHFLSTARGLAYEVLERRDGRVLGGLYDPDSHRRYEWPLPPTFGYTHTGRDPSGELWFWENHSDHAHDLWFLQDHRGPDDDEWVRLSGDWPTSSTGQRSHFHPQLTPDRQWILFTAGVEGTGQNHLHLIDVSDLASTRGLGPERLRR